MGGRRTPVVAADLWLVERLPNGTEAQRSQPLSVRGLPNRPFPFYFDSIVDGNVTLDFYGILISRLEIDASGSLCRDAQPMGSGLATISAARNDPSHRTSR